MEAGAGDTAQPIPMGARTSTVEVLSLETNLDQIEAGINEAHGKLDRVIPRPPEDTAPGASDGARATAARCSDKLAELNQRLITLGELVGTV